MAASNADALEAELDDMLGTAPLGGERPGDAAVSVATGTKPPKKTKEKKKKERAGNAPGVTGASVGESDPDAAGIGVASAADDDYGDDDDGDGDSVVLDVAREHMYATSSEFTEAGHGVRRVVCWCATAAAIVVLVLMVVWAARGF